VKFFFRFTHL